MLNIAVPQNGQSFQRFKTPSANPILGGQPQISPQSAAPTLGYSQAQAPQVQLDPQSVQAIVDGLIQVLPQLIGGQSIAAQPSRAPAQLQAQYPQYGQPGQYAQQTAFKGRRTVELGAQAVESFPTWTAWGVTNVFMENLSGVTTDVTLQAGAAAPEPIRLQPAGTDGAVEHVGRQWAGLTVWIQNASRDPNSVVRVTVW